MSFSRRLAIQREADPALHHSEAGHTDGDLGQAYAMEARILRPMLWFGLLEYRSENIPDSRFAARHYYRKTALFDRLLAFDVKMDFSEGPRR